MPDVVQGEKYLWKLPQHHQQTVCSLAASYNLSFPIVQVLLNRGYASREDIDSFLFSSFEKDVAHPSLLKDAQLAVDRILYAIKQNEKILVFGDYDVDGITSSSMMMLSLLPLNADINFFLPHRVRDGYGLSTKIVERAAQNKYALIITVDNGITAIEPVARAQELGVDVIITDHHRPHDVVPPAYAIVNPNQEDCEYPFKHLAGVGVIFKVLSLLYENLGKELPKKAYELLLLGTIADVVPLTGENRFWVRHGLQYINTTESFAFKVLKKNSNLIKPVVTAKDIGFSVAPQINALGRLEDPRDGVKFLIGSNNQEIERVGKVLFELNQSRKEIERGIFHEIVAQIKKGHIDLAHENIIIAASKSWPPGVIGLVASRLVGAYGKPTLLFHITKDGLAKGSCRSIPEFNIFDALQSCSDIINNFGGHSFAAGLALPQANIDELKQRLESLISSQLTEYDLLQKMALDAELILSDLQKKFITDMQHLEPFGNNNDQPIFYVKNVALVQSPRLLKDAHVKCMIFADGVIKPIIFFNRPELFEKFLNQESESFDVAVQVTENYWNGNTSIEMIGIDVKF